MVTMDRTTENVADTRRPAMDPLSIIASTLAIIAAGEKLVKIFARLGKLEDAESQRLDVLQQIASVQKTIQELDSQDANNDWPAHRIKQDGIEFLPTLHDIVFREVSDILSSLEQSMSPFSRKPKNFIRKANFYLHHKENAEKFERILQTAASRLEIRFAPLRLEEM